MKLFIALILMLGCGFHASADSSWRPGSEDIYSAFRSNAPHYWGWLKNQKKSVLYAYGIVAGDAHILNFGDIQLRDGGREFALIDMDDGGRGSLVGDFVRFVVGNQLSPYRVSGDDLIKSYRYGLNGVEAMKPEILKRVESKDDNEFAKRQNKYIDKMTSNNRFSENAGLNDLASAPEDVMKIYNAAKEDFFAQMPGYRILDAGYKVKSSGGSQGLVRFWFLLSKNDSRYIVEFKLESSPAVAEFTDQESHMDRFAQVAEIYRPLAPLFGPYKFISAGNRIFLMRARLSAFLDFDPSKVANEEDLRNGQLMSIYIANRMGLLQRQQGLQTSVLDGSGADEIKSLATAYINLIISLNR